MQAAEQQLRFAPVAWGKQVSASLAALVLMSADRPIN
jgi:hypothetical protein